MSGFPDNPSRRRQDEAPADASAALPRAFLHGQIRLLEKLARGGGATNILEDLVRLIERLTNEFCGSVMRYEADSKTLDVVAAPRLPAEYTAAIDGMEAGPSEGSCGTAAWTREAVITEDVEQDERWAAYREAIRPHGLRACWSFPIEAPDGDLLGTFAFYHPEPKAPTPDERRLIEEASHLASVVMSRTRRKKALRTTRQRHHQFLDEVPVGVYRTTPDGTLLYANDALIRMLGAESFDTLRATDVLTWYAEPHGRAAFKDEMEERGFVEQREATLVRVDGETIDTVESARAVRDNTGEIQYYEGIIQDVTKRTEAQRALRESKEKLRAILENAQATFFIIDNEGTFLLLEGGDFDAFGLEPEDATDTSIYELFENHPQFIHQIERALAGDTVRATVPIEEATFETWCTPRTNQADAVVGCIGMATNITEHRQAETQLRETKNFYEQVFKDLPLDIAVFDPEARFTYVNPHAMTDPERREWIRGHTNEEYCRNRGLDPEIGAQRDEAIRRVVETKEIDQIEETIETSAGTRHYLRIHLPVINFDGRVPHVVGCGLDITERVQYEQELRTAKQEAEEASRLKSAMLANMSHEIRTPLTSIIGFAEVLVDQGTDVDVGHLAGLIGRSGKRLLNTMDSVLQLSKLEAGAQKLNREPIDLTELAKTVLEEHQARNTSTNPHLHLESPADPVLVHCDPMAVDRILTNLVTNSLKFTEPGGQVTVRTFWEGADACLEVEDTGIGMSTSFQEEMFEAFKQESEGLRRSYEGSGLGLAIVRQLVEAHGGSLDVESVRGEGTTISVRLPGSE